MVKSTVKDKGEFEYPKLMMCNSTLVVLFSGPGVGTVVHPRGSLRVGEHYTSFSMKDFVPFNHQVILEN